MIEIPEPPALPDNWLALLAFTLIDQAEAGLPIGGSHLTEWAEAAAKVVREQSGREIGAALADLVRVG